MARWRRSSDEGIPGTAFERKTNESANCSSRIEKMRVRFVVSGESGLGTTLDVEPSTTLEDVAGENC